MSLIRTAFIFFFVFVSTVLCGTSASICSIFDRNGRLWGPISRLWGWTCLKLGVTRVDVKGREQLAVERGAIVMANHQSHLDPPALIYLSPSPVRFLTKRSLFFIPIFGWTLWALGHIPINRRDRKSAFESIDKAAATISKGKLVVIFPEGTRSHTDELLPFKKGGFVLAVRGGIPIIPAGISGTHQAFKKGFNTVERGPISVVFGEPIDTTAYSLETKEDLMQLVHSRILSCREEAIARRALMLKGQDQAVSPAESV